MNNLSSEELILDIQKYFPEITKLRDNQEEIIRGIIDNERDIFAMLSTGAGKSLCYQYPALKQSGVTLVITPLIALMTDQVSKLKENNISAEFLNSEQSTDVQLEIYNKVENNELKLLFVAPEKLSTPKFIAFAQKIDISMVVVDEAHCISMWGYGFRPSYLAIGNFVKILKKRPIIASFTATASVPVQNDIVALLNLKNPLIIRGSVIRNNLNLSIKQSKSKMHTLYAFLAKHKDVFGIIYCSKTEDVDRICDALERKSYNVGKYYGQMENLQKQACFDKFMSGENNIMVATNAFGMGIDKSDIRYVIHYELSNDFESFYQEIGRAGRDGEKSICILYYCEDDANKKIKQTFIPDNRNYVSKDVKKLIGELSRQRFKAMNDYARLGEKASSQTLNKFISDYFSNKMYSDFIEQKTKLQAELIASLYKIRDLYVNVSKVAGEIRKGNYQPNVLQTVTVGERVKNSPIVTFRLTEKLTYFDMMIADAVYTLILSGKTTIHAKAIMELLSGDINCTLKPDRKAFIDASLEKMMNIDFFLDNTKGISKLVTSSGKYLAIYKGKFLPLVKSGKSSYKCIDKPLLYQYSEHMEWEFFKIPLENLLVTNKNEKKMPDSIENLKLKFYISWRIMLSTKNKSDKDIRKMSFIIKFVSNDKRRKGLFELLDIDIPTDKYEAERKKKTFYRKIEEVLSYLNISWRYIVEKRGSSKTNITGIVPFLLKNERF